MKAGYKLSWEEIKSGVVNSILLSSAVMLGTIPMFQYQFRSLTSALFTIRPTEQQIFYLAVGQSFILFCVAILCSLVGFFYSAPLNLPGLGGIRDGLKWMTAGVGIGLLLTPIFYYSCDFEVYIIAPELFPESWRQALFLIIGNALAQEIVVRFGLVTIGVYLLTGFGYKGYPWPVVIIVSLFGAFGHYLFIAKFNLDLKLSAPQIAVAVLATFLFQVLYSDTFVRRGLIPAMGLHLGAGVKSIIYSIAL